MKNSSKNKGFAQMYKGAGPVSDFADRIVPTFSTVDPREKLLLDCVKRAWEREMVLQR